MDTIEAKKNFRHNGEPVTKQPLIKTMRVVKKETLKLISCWVERSNDPQMVLDNFIPPLLDAVLLDYQRCAVPSAREPEVLTVMGVVVNKLKNYITPQVMSNFFGGVSLIWYELFP